MGITLSAVGMVLVGFFVPEIVVAVLGRRPTFQTVFVSAIAGLTLGLVLNPITGALFTPTVGGLVTATIFGFLGGLLFYVAHTMGMGK